MASREFTTQIYAALRQAGLKRTDPLREILAGILKQPTGITGEGAFAADFGTKMNQGVAAVQRNLGVAESKAQKILSRLLKKVLPKGDPRLTWLKGGKVAAASTVASVQPVAGTATATSTVGKEALRDKVPVEAIRRITGTAEPVKRGGALALRGGEPDLMAMGKKAAGKVAGKANLLKNVKFGLSGLFALLAVKDLAQAILGAQETSRGLDVQESAMNPQAEYYRQAQPLLQQDLAVSQAQLMQAFGGGGGGGGWEGGGMSPVTGETVIGGNR